jgi:hypothetical protein
MDELLSVFMSFPPLSLAMDIGAWSRGYRRSQWDMAVPSFLAATLSSLDATRLLIVGPSGATLS